MEALCSFSALASATLKAASSGLGGRVEVCASGAGAAAVSAIVSVRREEDKILGYLRNRLRSEGPVKDREKISSRYERERRTPKRGGEWLRTGIEDRRRWWTVVRKKGPVGDSKKKVVKCAQLVWALPPPCRTLNTPLPGRQATCCLPFWAPFTLWA